MYTNIDKARQLRMIRGVRDTLRTAKKYSLIGAAVLGFAYVSDKCDAGEKIDYTIKKGIEYIISK